MSAGADPAAASPTPALTRKDFTSEQEVRWCPGCGDFAILSAVQSVFPQLGIPRENFVIVSGIGCSSRFPYYMNTYGLHGIHGRAVAIASGLAISREDLSVWVVTGDGDALSIGGNHLIHALRRNVEIKILMFNNEIYGLTKGQASPTSERGKITKSTPHGSLDSSFNPISVALGTEATFVARALAPDREALTDILRRAASHRGSAFVEIYQNCTIFNDGTFDSLTSPEGRLTNQIRLEHGKPIRFGKDNEKGVVVTPDAAVEIVDVSEAGEENLLIHNEHAEKPNLAFSLSRLAGGPNQPTPLGIFWDVERPSYGEMMRAQIEAVRARGGPRDLESLWTSGDTWTVE